MTDPPTLTVYADTPLQVDMARAIIGLVKAIEHDAEVNHHTTNGMYRVKLSGHKISVSYERLYDELAVVVQSE